MMNCDENEVMDKAEGFEIEGSEEETCNCIEDICQSFFDGVEDCRINVKSFQNGINSVSSICGAIVALTSVGVDPETALTFLSDQETNRMVSKNNIDMAKISADSSIKMSKLESVNTAKATI